MNISEIRLTKQKYIVIFVLQPTAASSGEGEGGARVQGIPESSHPYM